MPLSCLIQKTLEVVWVWSCLYPALGSGSSVIGNLIMKMLLVVEMKAWRWCWGGSLSNLHKLTAKQSKISPRNTKFGLGRNSRRRLGAAFRSITLLAQPWPGGKNGNNDSAASGNSCLLQDRMQWLRRTEKFFQGKALYTFYLIEPNKMGKKATARVPQAKAGRAQSWKEDLLCYD